MFVCLFDRLESTLEDMEYQAAVNIYYALDAETNKEIIATRGDTSVKNKILAIKSEWNFDEFKNIKIIGNEIFLDDVQGFDIDKFYIQYMNLINTLYYFNLEWYQTYEEQINRENEPIYNIDEWGNYWRVHRQVMLLR